jgi:hypothetical protein
VRLAVVVLLMSVAGCATQPSVVAWARAPQTELAPPPPTGPLRVVHQALIAGQWRRSDDETWRRSGERDAVLDYAARTLGCPVAALKADKPHHLWIVDGCAQGVFASVSQWLRAPSEVQVLATEFFFNLANEDPATAYDAMLPAVPGGDGEWLVQGDRGDVLTNLEQLAAINHAGARDLGCPRSRVAHDVVSLRGGRITIVEGCDRRATYLDTDPHAWRLLSIVDLGRVNADAAAASRAGS